LAILSGPNKTNLISHVRRGSLGIEKQISNFSNGQELANKMPPKLKLKNIKLQPVNHAKQISSFTPSKPIEEHNLSKLKPLICQEAIRKTSITCDSPPRDLYNASPIIDISGCEKSKKLRELIETQTRKFENLQNQADLEKLRTKPTNEESVNSTVCLENMGKYTPREVADLRKKTDNLGLKSGACQSNASKGLHCIFYNNEILENSYN